MQTHSLPNHASVIVIGGGVMGCSTLYHLAKQGVSDAILLERNQLTSGTTWHSAAQVRALRSTRNLTDLIKYSISLYGSLEEETGQQTGWINKGSLSIATNHDRLMHIKRQESLAHLFGVEASSISTAEAKERWPLMNAEDVIGAVWSPGDGRVSPSDLCAALAKGAKNRGAKIFENTSVTDIITEGNRIIGIETPGGQIKCDAIALCTGLWSRKSAALAGVNIPVWPCEHFYLLTKPVDGITGNMPTLSDHDGHLYIRDDSGGLLVGCFEPMGKPISPEQIGENTPFQLLAEDWDHFEPMMMNALHRLPCLETAEVKMLLNGPESFTPDGSFLLGESAETKGLFLGCGMNSVGVATGGGAGMALAHCITHGHTPTDLHEADPKRFPDCFNSVEALTARIPEVLGEHYAITYPGYQFSTARNLRTTPLHQKWTENQPYFGQFGGWERPLYFNCPDDPVLGFGKPSWFDQVGVEVKQAHEKVAIFDQSTFGKISVTGPDAETFLNRVCANNMRQPVGRIIYTAMLNQRGGFESDLTALRLSDESYRLYVGTSAIKRDLSWLRGHLLDGERVRIVNETEQYAVIGLMGPETKRVMNEIGAPYLNEIRYFHHAQLDIAGLPVTASRLSYVGESGWEITCETTDAPVLFDLFASAGAKPAGIFTQTSMRIEKGFLAYGHDLDTDVTPLQAGLGFALDWNSNFIGRQALSNLVDQPQDTTIVSVAFKEKSVYPLGNEPVYYDGCIVGKTTSAAFGYRVDSPVALVSLKTEGLNFDDVTVQVDIAGQRFDATVSSKALFDPKGKRMKVQ
ncbi:MAG: FAD-dependent oxidoreductase [Gammaproteobacteria bacterium]|nr:FAD-dependent oxidoreductase [Gammaproteobacteria bacterium]